MQRPTFDQALIRLRIPIAFVLAVVAASATPPLSKEKRSAKPVNTQTPAAQKEVILGGGCFWGMEDLLRKQPGVLSTEVGYSGGTFPNPTYEDMKTGVTGHAEVVKIVYDLAKTNLDALLDFYFKIHDPTTLNRQGNDRGTQYRSIAFYSDAREKAAIEAAIQRAEASGRWKSKVVTEVKPKATFYRAEEYHQDYLVKNPGGYTCHFVRP